MRVFQQILFQGFDPYEWCLNYGLHSAGLNPQPLGRESSALTARPRLFAFKIVNYYFITGHKQNDVCSRDWNNQWRMPGRQRWYVQSYVQLCNVSSR